jgi:hypothetical protein
MMNFDCYYEKNALHLIKFSLLAMICNFGLYFVTTPTAKIYRKSAGFSLAPTAIISPFIFDGSTILIACIAPLIACVGYYHLFAKEKNR